MRTRTFWAGSNDPARPVTNRPGYRTYGFSLLELLLVLVLLVAVYGLAVPMLGAGSIGLESKAAVRQLTAGLRKARSVAISGQREASLSIDVAARTFSVTDDPRVYALSQQIGLAVFTAESELANEQTGSIRFFPDGSSTGGRITVSAGEAKQYIDIDWLTGRAEVSEP